VTEVLGRDRECRAIDDLLETATARPAALVLDGDAGMGKTTLWRAGVEAARQRGLQVLAASPSEAETGLAFAALTDLLDPVLTDLLPRLPQPQRRALEVAVLREDPDGPAPEPRAIASAFLAAVRALAEGRPLVVAIDDVQWLDAPTVSALRFALRRLDAEPVALLLARRSTAATEFPFELDGPAYAERVSRLRLGPLSPSALHQMVRGRLGLTLPRPLLVRVHEAAGGNPFFALELARELQHAGADPAPGEPLPVPDTLRTLIADRMARLDTDVRDALLVVASVSDPTVGLVEAVLGTAAVDRLHTAAGLEIVEIRAGRVRFTHPLIGSAVYERATPGQRRRAHLLLADHVATADERARQLALGSDAPDERVAAALDEAAVNSAGRGAPETAAEFFEWARRLTPATSHADVVRRSIAAGRHHLAAGDPARARAVLERALADAADSDLRAHARHGLARVALRDTGWTEFTSLLARALEEATEPAFRCRIELDLAGGLMQSHELRRALPHARRATARARELDCPDLLADALSYQAMADALTGRGASLDLVREGLTAAAAVDRNDLDDAQSDLPPELGLGSVLKWADDFSGARRVLDRLRLALERRQAHASLPPTLFQLAELESWAGNWERADALARRGREVAELTGGASWEPVALYPEVLLDALRGGVDAARAAGAAGLELCRQIANLRHGIRFRAVLGFTELSVGDAAAAREHLARAAELASSAGYGEPAVFRFEHDHIESVLAVGDIAAARPLVAALDAHADALGGPWCEVMSARCRGLLRAAEGDLDDAAAELDRALDAHDGLDQPFERARTLLALGRVRRRARRWSLAREAIDEAIAMFDDLGAALWAANARDDLQRLGGRRPAGSDLTASEERIVALVAQGRSNKEVAAELFLAPKTVETQLTRIYAKLGVHSRTELAHRYASAAAEM
jgi:DNA-binding CsgD family transcriptional regulator